jgi:hypothetical protein
LGEQPGTNITETGQQNQRIRPAQDRPRSQTPIFRTLLAAGDAMTPDGAALWVDAVDRLMIG